MDNELKLAADETRRRLYSRVESELPADQWARIKGIMDELQKIVDAHGNEGKLALSLYVFDRAYDEQNP